MYTSTLVNKINGIMKELYYLGFRQTVVVSLALLFLMGCEREFSDDVVFASFPNNGDVFLLESILETTKKEGGQHF